MPAPVIASLALVVFSVALYVAVRTRNRALHVRMASMLAAVLVLVVIGIPVGLWVMWATSSIGKP